MKGLYVGYPPLFFAFTLPAPPRERKGVIQTD